MNNKIKYILLIFIAILIAQSFSKVYVDYNQYKFLSNFESNSYTIRFNYNLDERIEEEKVISDLTNYLKENNIIMYSFEYTSYPVFSYYNPSNIDEWDKVIKEYSNECKHNCIEINTLTYEDLSVNSTYGIVSYDADLNIEELTSLSNVVVIGYENGEEHNDEHVESDMNFFIEEYKIYALTSILLIISLVFIFYLDLFKTIDKLRLYSIYGYPFKIFYNEFFKKSFLYSYILLFTVSSILFTVNHKTIDSLFFIVMLNLVIFIIVTLVLTLLSMIIYNNVKNQVKYNILSLSIIFMSIVISFFIITTVSLLSIFIYNLGVYNDTNISNNITSNHYKVTFDQNIDLDTDLSMSETLLNDYGAISIQFIPEGTNPSFGNNNVLIVDENFLKNNIQIKNEDGTAIDITDDSKYYVLTTSDNVGDYYINNPDGFKILKVIDDGRDYNTYDPFIPYTKLENTTIEIQKDVPLLSNLYLKADSQKDAQKIYSEVYALYGVEVKPNVYPVSFNYFENDAKIKVQNSMHALILTIICIVIGTLFYTFIIFTKYRYKIVLAHIFGYSTAVCFKFLIKEIFAVFLSSIIILMVLFKISIFEYVILINVLLLELIFIYINYRILLRKSVVNFIKGDT